MTKLFELRWSHRPAVITGKYADAKLVMTSPGKAKIKAMNLEELRRLEEFYTDGMKSLQSRIDPILTAIREARDERLHRELQKSENF